MPSGKRKAALPPVLDSDDEDDELFRSAMGAPPRGVQSSGTGGRAPRLMRAAADAGEAERRRLSLEEDAAVAAAAQADEYAKEVQKPRPHRAPKRSADEANKDELPAKPRGEQQPAVDEEDTDDEDECPLRPKKRRKRRPKSAAPLPAAVPSPAAQLAALAKLPGGEQLLELMGSQKGTPDELAFDAARRSDTVLKPPAHKPLAIKKAKKSNRGRGGAKVGRDGGISSAAKRKSVGEAVGETAAVSLFGMTRQDRELVAQVERLKQKKKLNVRDKAALKKKTAELVKACKAARKRQTHERDGADRRRCPFCAWCCSISAPASGNLGNTAMSRHIKDKHANKSKGCKPWEAFLKGLPKEKK